MSVFLRPAKVNIFWAEAKPEMGNNWGERDDVEQAVAGPQNSWNKVGVIPASRYQPAASVTNQ